MDQQNSNPDDNNFQSPPPMFPTKKRSSPSTMSILPPIKFIKSNERLPVAAVSTSSSSPSVGDENLAGTSTIASTTTTAIPTATETDLSTLEKMASDSMETDDQSMDNINSSAESLLSSKSDDKSPLMILNEKYSSISSAITVDMSYVADSSTDTTRGRPYFKAHVFVGDREFNGEGFSKKLAKHGVAKNVLEFLQSGSTMPSTEEVKDEEKSMIEMKPDVIVIDEKPAAIEHQIETDGGDPQKSDSIGAESIPTVSNAPIIDQSTSVNAPIDGVQQPLAPNDDTSPSIDRQRVIERVLNAAKWKRKNAAIVLNQLCGALRLGRVDTSFVSVSQSADTKAHNARFVCVLKLNAYQPATQQSTTMDASADDGGGPRGGEQAPSIIAQYESDPTACKKEAVQNAAKKALAGSFGIDTSMFDEIEKEDLKSIIQGKELVQAMRELCVRKGYKVDGDRYEPPSESRGHRSIYTINGKEYEGESTANKKQARRMASVRILKDLFGLDVDDGQATTLAANTGTIGQHHQPSAIETGPTTTSSTIAALERIGAVACVPVVYETISTTPQFGAKVHFGTNNADGYGHTFDEAKSKAALGILTLMGLGQFYGGRQQGTDAGNGETSGGGGQFISGPQYAQQQHQMTMENYWTGTAQGYGWPTVAGGGGTGDASGWNTGDNNSTAEEYWNDAYQPAYQPYQHPVRPRGLRGAGGGGGGWRPPRGGRGGGGYAARFGNDLHQHFGRQI